MRIAIIGMGGVGGFFGGKLALHYASAPAHEIFFVARGTHLETIRNTGLKVITADGEFTAMPTQATDDPSQLGPLDLIIISVKGYDLENAARMISGNLHAGSVTIPLLNGVDNVERLQPLVREGSLLNGCVYVSAFIAAPGTIKHAGGPGTLIFGPGDGNIEPYKEIETTLADAGINAVLSDHITIDVWSKYIFIGPLAGLTSMAAQPLGAILENDLLRTKMEGMMNEIKLIADAQGISLPPDIVTQSLATASNFPYETKSSLQLDFEKGGQTEIETFTGYVVNTGRKLGIQTPHHDEVYAALT